jgi:type VI secretion system ImpA family protein
MIPQGLEPAMDSLLAPVRGIERLVAPIGGENPSGVPVLNSLAYDQIKRAITAAEKSGADARKTMATVVEQASEILASQSKDINIAVWLAAALAWTRGLDGAIEGLTVLTRLVDEFWNTIYPVIEDGDEGFRQGPIEQICSVLVRPTLAVPVAREYSVQDYMSSRGGGPPSAEDVDRAIQAGEGASYESIIGVIERCRSQLSALQEVCNKRFTSYDCKPDFTRLFAHFDRIAGVFEAILASMPDTVADLPKPPAPASLPPAVPPSGIATIKRGTSVDGKSDLDAAPADSANPPLARQEPAKLVLDAAAALFAADHTDPVPYLLTRGIRFGRLMAAEAPLSPELLEAPSLELRTSLRRAVLSQDWNEVLRCSEEGTRSQCGSSWLDLQFRADQACRELGLGRPSAAIRGALVGYLRAVPELMEAMLVDGTPACSAETVHWLRTEVLPDPKMVQAESLLATQKLLDAPEAPPEADSRDPFEEAVDAFGAGHFSLAVRILDDARKTEMSGRGRLQRRIQQAQIAMKAGRYRFALPILREVSRTIEQMRLDTWESGEWVGHPLAMLCTCLDQLKEDRVERQRVYEQLCAVDPDRALELDSV